MIDPADFLDEKIALGILLSENPRLELRRQLFPGSRIVLAVHFGNVGGTTIPAAQNVVVAARRG